MISGEAATSNIDITQKLQLLTIQFPKLRLVWSPSPYATAQLFDELKQGKLEPNPNEAAALGSDENTKELDTIADRLNTNIYDFLLKLPGITTRNVAKVMTNVKNLKELIKFNKVKARTFQRQRPLRIIQVFYFRMNCRNSLVAKRTLRCFGTLFMLHISLSKLIQMITSHLLQSSNVADVHEMVVTILL